MNREHLDSIIKKSLAAYAESLLSEIGHHFISARSLTGQAVAEREEALAFVLDDAARLKIVDAILKEMK